MSAFGFLILFILGNLFTTNIVGAYVPPSIHHTLAIDIVPDTHRLTATDTLHLPNNLFDQAPLSFALNPHFTIDRIELNGQAVAVSPNPTKNPGQ